MSDFETVDECLVCAFQFCFRELVKAATLGTVICTPISRRDTGSQNTPGYVNHLARGSRRRRVLLVFSRAARKTEGSAGRGRLPKAGLCKPKLRAAFRHTIEPILNFAKSNL